MEQTMLDLARAELSALVAAVELHRPVRYDRHAVPLPIGGTAEVKWTRCTECRESVTADGCRTWRTANGH